MAGWGRVDNHNPSPAFRGHPYLGQIQRPNNAVVPDVTLEAMLNSGESGIELNNETRPQQMENNPVERIQRDQQFHNAQRFQGASHIEQKGQDGREFRNPTDINSIFARSMSQITCNPSSTSQGRVSRSIEFNDQLNKQLQMALAINLGLNGQQMVKERALHNVLTSESVRGNVKQIRNSLAEIYGDALDPN